MVREISERVILHWNYRGLTKLPAELEVCGHHVNELYLKHNLLSALPDWLGCLTNLTNIYLQANSLTQLSESVCCLVSLEVLDVSENSLQSLPNSVGQLSKLTKLILTGNKLETLPDSLGNLRNLKSLQLSSNKFRHVPEAVKYCQSLYELCLDRNRLRSLPSFLTRLPNLKLLSVCGNELRYLPSLPFAKLERFLFDNNRYLTNIPYPLACQLSKVPPGSNISPEMFSFSVYGCFQFLDPVPLDSTSVMQIFIKDPEQGCHILNLGPFSLCRDIAKLAELSLRALVNNIFQLNGVNRERLDSTYDTWTDNLESLVPRNLVEKLKQGPLAFCANPSCNRAVFLAAYPLLVPKCIARRQDHSGLSFQKVYCTLLFCSTACSRDFYASSSPLQRQMLDSQIPYYLIQS